MRSCSLALITLLWSCAAPADEEQVPGVGLTPPTGAVIETSGFATIEKAPPEPFSATPPGPEPEAETERIARESGISVAEAELRMNPDEATMHAANALMQKLRSGAPGNFVGTRIIRDPKPRYVFHFREKGAATLARFSSDARFQAVDGGVPFEELDPILQQWLARFQKHRLASSANANIFEGMVEVDIGVSRAEYEAIAAKEGWQLPPMVRLDFAQEINPASTMAPDVAPFVRTFARADREPGIILSIAKGGRIVLRDGCFRMDAPKGEDPLVLFGRNTQLVRDSEGYLMLRSLTNKEARGRIGEAMIWGGYPGGVEEEQGVKALRAHCGSGPIESVGEPTSARLFRIRPGAIDAYVKEKRISRQKAWEEITACWQRQEEQEADRPGPHSTYRECDLPHPPAAAPKN